jgi:hypothetical protein
MWILEMFEICIPLKMALLDTNLVLTIPCATKLSLYTVLSIKFGFEISISALFVFETNFTANTFLKFSVISPYTAWFKFRKFFRLIFLPAFDIVIQINVLYIQSLTKFNYFATGWHNAGLRQSNHSPLSGRKTLTKHLKRQGRIQGN